MYFLVMLELPLVHTAASWKISLSFFLGTLHLYSSGFLPHPLHAAVNELLTTKETSRSGKANASLAHQRNVDGKAEFNYSEVGSGDVFNIFRCVDWPAGGSVVR